MIVPFESVENKPKKWYKNPAFWILAIAFQLVIIIIIFTLILLLNRHGLGNEAQFEYSRLDRNIYEDNYEIYQINISSKGHRDKQYRLLGDFLRQSLFNKSTYDKMLPSCPIIYSMSMKNYPGDWRAMLFATEKLPKNDEPYPYICYLSVLPTDRRHKLASILLNRFINDMLIASTTHIQLHANWENCPAQNLYRRCGFRCNQFTLNGYSKPFEEQYQYGHMIRLELNLANIKQPKDICYDSHAIQISSTDELYSKKLCEENLPKGLLNLTCN